MELEKSGYMKPYPQDNLSGELGLSANELGIALGIAPSLVRAKIKRDEVIMNIGMFRSVQNNTLNNSGRLFGEWYLNVDSCKYIVAGWKNSMGVGYFQYLLACEKAIEEEMPKLKSMLKTMIDKFIKPKKTKRYTLTYTLKEGTDIFGEYYSEYVTERKLIEDVTSQEYEASKFAHSIRTQEGISKSINNSLKSGKIVPIAIAKAIGEKNKPLLN